MKTATAFSIIGGLALVGSFVNSIYVGLFDTTLAQEDPLHHDINWVIGIISLVAGIALLARPKSIPARIIGGVVWPVLYLVSLAVDVQTELCFGTNVHCWPSVSDSYKYLILNQSVEGWVLSPYTMRILIALLVISIVLTVGSLLLSFKSRGRLNKDAKTIPPLNSKPSLDQHTTERHRFLTLSASISLIRSKALFRMPLRTDCFVSEALHDAQRA